MSNETEKHGRGRPKKEGSKRTKFNVRFDNDCEEMVNELAYFNDKSKSDIVREAIRWYYEINKSNFC